MPIHTLLGPIEADALGPTSMHEHLLSDGRIWSRQSAEEPPEKPGVIPENLGYIRWNFLSMPENLVLEDEDLAVEELDAVARAGGSAIVDLTVPGLGRRLEDVVEIARRSQVTIITGCGFYVEPTHPHWLGSAGVDEVTGHLIGELTEGIGGTDVRPALMGEIGTSHPIAPNEVKVLRACAAAAVETGAAVNVHLSPRAAHGLQVIEILTGEGMRTERIILSHMDEYLDRDYHLAAAEAGVVLEFDTFGSEFYYGGLFKNPTDRERLDYVEMLLEHGHAEQLVVGCDVWSKTNLRAYGGMGYDHLFKRIMPAMRDTLQIDQKVIDGIFVSTPRRLLDRP